MQQWRATCAEPELRLLESDFVSVVSFAVNRWQLRDAVCDRAYPLEYDSAIAASRHVIQNLAHSVNLVAVEWSFEAVHAGRFANVEPTGKQVRVPGCSFYAYDLSRKAITAGRIYFDVATLLRQIGA